MKKVWMAVALTMVVLTGCTLNNFGRKIVFCNDEVINKDMGLTGFDRIVVNGSADLKYAQAEGDGVEVMANKDVFPYLRFRVEEGALYLETVDSVQLKAEKFEVYAASSNL